MRGSWPVLAAALVGFLAGFAVLRNRDVVLRTEASADALRTLARANGLPPASVLALRAATPGAADAEFAATVVRFAALARELGEPLAAVALGDAALVRTRMAAAGGDAVRAWQGLRAEAAALPGVEFEVLRGRFAARASGQER